jgi:signal peptidase I
MSDTQLSRDVAAGTVRTAQWWRRSAVLAVLTVLMVAVARAGVMEPYEVRSDSMAPTVT